MSHVGQFNTGLSIVSVMKCHSEALFVTFLCFSGTFDQILSDSDPGEALYLTPYLEKGRIRDARAAAKVNPLLEGVVSYSGYLTVDKRFNSNLFFWFFPCKQSWETRPLLLWLQGGPGASSLLGLLFENGPIHLSKDGLKKNPYSWSQYYNVIYLDNPVGSGFSFTGSSEGYPRNQEDIGSAVYNALLQFFILFPELKSNPFFLTGESYAGKYVPSVAQTIHENNQKSRVKINLKGLFIGNGMVDPVNMLHYGEYLYQLGLIDEKAKMLIEKYETLITKQIAASEWEEATNSFSMLLMDYYYSESTIFQNLTGLTQHYNYVDDSAGTDDFQPFVTNSTVRKSIHVGRNQFSDGKRLALALKQDVMKSMKPVVERLLENYDIMFYNGQLDIICAYPLTENVLRGLRWSRSDEFAQAQASIWRVDGKVAGYRRSGGRLSLVLVRNAGHMVPTDQPQVALALLNDFISQTLYNYYSSD